jgi:hypothetical protein
MPAGDDDLADVESGRSPIRTATATAISRYRRDRPRPALIEPASDRATLR